MSKEPKIFSTLVYRCYLTHIRLNYPTIDLGAILEGLGVTLEYMSRSSNWVSINFDYHFTKILIKVTGDPLLPFHAGLLIYTKDNCGPVLSRIIRLSADFDGLYRLIPRSVRYFNRIIRINYQANSSAGNIFYRIIVDYSSLDSFGKDTELLKKNLLNIYRNIIGHICSIRAMRLQDSSKRSEYYILELNSNYCDVVIMQDYNNRPSIVRMREVETAELMEIIFGKPG